MVGGKVIDVRRRAKLIEIDLNNGQTLLIHLKMTGQLLYQKDNEGYVSMPLAPLKSPIPNKSTHVIFSFNNGAKLYFNDLRKFGYVKILPTKDAEHTRILSEFGPEPLDPAFKLNNFREQLKKRKNQKIKQLLLEQKFLAGVGNIYANEALYVAKINPKKVVSDLSEAEIERLHHAIKKVLEIGLKVGGASDRTYVNAFGEEGRFMDYAKIYGKVGQVCHVCGSKFERIKLGGRGTFFCPVCQK